MLGHSAGRGVDGSLDWLCGLIDTHTDLSLIGETSLIARYVFNAAGQEIDVLGLLCLFDAEGPCGNAVKDSQRTKTTPETRRTLSVVWGCAGHEARLARAAAWYRELLGRAGAQTAGFELDVASR